MTLSPVSFHQVFSEDQRAVLARVYAYLIEQGRLRKKQNVQPAADSQVAALTASTQQDDPACPNA